MFVHCLGEDIYTWIEINSLPTLPSWITHISNSFIFNPQPTDEGTYLITYNARSLINPGSYKRTLSFNVIVHTGPVFLESFKEEFVVYEGTKGFLEVLPEYKSDLDSTKLESSVDWMEVLNGKVVSLSVPTRVNDTILITLTD